MSTCGSRRAYHLSQHFGNPHSFSGVNSQPRENIEAFEARLFSYHQSNPHSPKDRSSFRVAGSNFISHLASSSLPSLILGSRSSQSPPTLCILAEYDFAPVESLMLTGHTRSRMPVPRPPYKHRSTRNAAAIDQYRNHQEYCNIGNNQYGRGGEVVSNSKHKFAEMTSCVT